MNKSTKLSYYGRVKDGKIEIPRKRLNKEVISTFDGHGIEIIFQRKRRYRSGQQNRYYWGVVVPAILSAFIDLGHDMQVGNAKHAEEIHEFLKERFLDNGKEIADANGELVKLPASTANCTTTEFMEYTDRVVQWAAEALYLAIPDPNEQMEAF